MDRVYGDGVRMGAKEKSQNREMDVRIKYAATLAGVEV